MNEPATGATWFIGIGAQRSGTTMLYEQLAGHADVYLPQKRKEVHYFDQYYDRGTDWYDGFFPPEAERASYRAIGEITPRYMVDPAVPARLHAWRPDCKLIAILRHPADRAFSQYTFRIRDFNEQRSFDQFIADTPDALERGYYAKQLARYRAHFSPDRMLVLIMEEAVRDREGLRSQLAAFLGLDAARFNPDQSGRRVNESYRVRHAGAYALARRAGVWLRSKDMDGLVNRVKTSGIKQLFGKSRDVPEFDSAARVRLHELFAEDIRELETLLERDLPMWREPK